MRYSERCKAGLRKSETRGSPSRSANFNARCRNRASAQIYGRKKKLIMVMPLPSSYTVIFTHGRHLHAMLYFFGNGVAHNRLSQQGRT
jgi:hypothetical protein